MKTTNSLSLEKPFELRGSEVMPPPNVSLRVFHQCKHVVTYSFGNTESALERALGYASEKCPFCRYPS